MSSRFVLLTGDELQNLPDPEWFIKGVIPKNATVVIYGPAGCGKTFVALSMALSISSGHQWCKKKTTKGAVLYVAAEGLYGLKNRVRAYQQQHRFGAADIHYLGVPVNLLKPDDITDFIKVLAARGIRPALIILDTLARVIVGGDENSARDMGIAVEGIERIKRETSATVLVVHHTGKKGETERGSSALRGAADAMIVCSRESESMTVSMRCDKMKDAEQFPDVSLGLLKIAVGDGRTSLTVTDVCEAILNQPLGSTENGELALEILQSKFGEGGATNSHWEKAFCNQTGKSASTFSRALKDLTGRVRIEGRGQGKRYFSVQEAKTGVSITPVSNRSHDTSQTGVSITPFSRG